MKLNKWSNYPLKQKLHLIFEKKAIKSIIKMYFLIEKTGYRKYLNCVFHSLLLSNQPESKRSLITPRKDAQGAPQPLETRWLWWQVPNGQLSLNGASPSPSLYPNTTHHLLSSRETSTKVQTAGSDAAFHCTFIMKQLADSWQSTSHFCVWTKTCPLPAASDLGLRSHRAGRQCLGVPMKVTMVWGQEWMALRETQETPTPFPPPLPSPPLSHFFLHWCISKVQGSVLPPPMLESIPPGLMHQSWNEDTSFGARWFWVYRSHLFYWASKSLVVNWGATTAGVKIQVNESKGTKAVPGHPINTTKRHVHTCINALLIINPSAGLKVAATSLESRVYRH